MRQKTQQVYFPLLHPQKGRLAAVKGFFRGERHLHPWRFGPNANAKQVVLEDLLTGLRFVEPHTTAEQAVALDFADVQAREVVGDSYALAVALVDKLIRFFPVKQVFPMVVATGGVACDSLKVLPVEGLTDKLRCVLNAQLPEGSYFFYPAASVLDAEQQALLSKLQTEKIHCVAVGSVMELESFWTGQWARQAKAVGWSSDLVWIAVLLGILAMIGLLLQA